MMKLFKVQGMIRCGHRTFILEKFIVADSRSEARDAYKVEHPHAKVTTVEYRYDVNRADGPHVIAQNFVKNS
jgi:hypothetical protein